MNGYRFVIQLQQKLLNSTVMKRYESFHFNSRTSANGSSRVPHTRASRYRGRHLRERQHSVQQRDEVMPSKRGSYSIQRPVPAPASVSPFHLSVAAKFPRLCPPSPLSCSVPLFPAPLPARLFLPSFLPSFLNSTQAAAPRATLQLTVTAVCSSPLSPLVSFCVCASSLAACRLQG